MNDIEKIELEALRLLKSGISKEEVESIIEYAKNSISVSTLRSKRLWFLKEEISKNSTAEVDETVVLEIVKQMNKLGYYFWVILDGADPHRDRG